MPHKSTPPVIRQCANCGADFHPSSSNIERGRGIYCSHSCYAQSHVGALNHGWKGGRTTHCDGYILRLAHGHPKANRTGYVLEHRLVMEEAIGRMLADEEVVHHINGVKSDNRIENLQLMTRSAHAIMHSQVAGWSKRFDCCIECGTADYPHQSRGLCKRCYYRMVYRRDHNVPPERFRMP